MKSMTKTGPKPSFPSSSLRLCPGSTVTSCQGRVQNKTCGCPGTKTKVVLVGLGPRPASVCCPANLYLSVCPSSATICAAALTLAVPPPTFAPHLPASLCRPLSSYLHRYSRHQPPEATVQASRLTSNKAGNGNDNGNGSWSFDGGRRAAGRPGF